MSRQKFKAWVTKYALTEGIKIVDAELCRADTMISYGIRGQSCAHGKEWHRTEEAALARASEMRQNRVKSLQKQLAKLESMPIKITDESVKK